MISGKRLCVAWLASFAVALATVSCAVQGGAPAPESAARGVPAQSAAARLGLAPGLRPFYDELEPYGDWVLVEPQGWVFRPRVNTVAWRPYQDGHWEPTYSFGWVWESHEPFGWITGNRSCSCAPQTREESSGSRAAIQLRLPLRVLISPLCERNRNGCARNQFGKVFVE